jgi:predicted small secreted protein
MARRSTGYHERATTTKKTILIIAAVATFGVLTAGCTYDETAGSDPAVATPSAPVEKAPAHPGETAGQENARESAESYLEVGAFSRTGLINQLSSSAGEGFSKADAIYAVDHVDVDWNEQAVKSARSYLEVGGFSRNGLYDSSCRRPVRASLRPRPPTA